MDRITGDQLSLIAENDRDRDCPQTDWAIDSGRVRDRSFEEIRSIYVDRANGGQAGLSPDPVGGNGGQAELLPNPAGGNGGQPGWIEIDKRKGGSYKYRRWRDAGGVKRSLYLGTVT